MAEAPETQDVLASRATKARVTRPSSMPEEQNAEDRGGPGEAGLDEEDTVSPDEDEESEENLDEESLDSLDEETCLSVGEGSDDTGTCSDETPPSCTESEESEEEGDTWDGTVGSGVCKEENVEGTNIAKTLKWLSGFMTTIFTKFRMTSLLRDFVESEFFVIDGDSLMMMYIHNATVDLGQNLHFFYLVEWFLSDLIQKQAKFVITFFKDLECIWNQSCVCLSIRTALILHLQHNTKIPVHTEFSSCFDPKWKTFLDKNHPYFVMISDTANPKRKRQCLSTGLFHTLMVHTLGNGINVVLTSGITQDILRLHGYHRISDARIISVFQNKAADLKQAEDWMLRCAPAFHSQVFTSTNGNKLMQTLHSEILQTISALKPLWPQGADVRRIVCAVSCSVALKIYGYKVAMAKSTGDETGASANKEEELEELSVQGATELCRMYCLHVALLCKLPLAQRALRSKAKWKKPAMPFLLLRRMAEFLVLRKLSVTHDWPVDLTYLPDLSDQHLFKSVVKICSKRPACTGSEPQLGREIGSEYRNIWEAVATISPALDVGSAFPVTCPPGLLLLPADATGPDYQVQGIPRIGLIPVTSDLVEEYLGEILGQVPQLDSEDPTTTSLLKLKEFDEVLHWHSRKPLIMTWKEMIQKLPTDPSERKSMLRQQQKYIVFERLYAESLEETAALTVVSSQVAAADSPSKSHSRPGKGSGKKSGKKRAELIIEAQKRKKMEEEERKDKEQWSSVQESLEKEMTQDIDRGMKTLDKFLKSCNSDQVKVDAHMEGIKHCYNAWVEHYRTTVESSRDMKTAVMLMQRIHTVLNQYEEKLSPKLLIKLAGYLKELGFLSLRDSLLERVDEQQLQKEKVKKGLMKDPKFPVGLGAARFQLKHMGPFLIREERSDRDPRVRHFIPDTWQRELLDAVDNNESAVIVAPTSSGKTYASYYCMEKVLRNSDSGVVVYVAPTKALVNQVMATVYGRFTKDLPHGMVVCGCFTRDYRSHVDSCQVLVTVPQCLEILLLCPHQQDWAKRIQYVIFDEVHCLGGEIGAEVWEHLLVMIRCPFLALSATISNPQDLTQWLQSVKTYWERVERGSEKTSSAATKQKGKRKEHTKSQSFKVRLVIYGERYNDLEKFVCDFERGQYKFVPYHPCAALTVDHIKNYGIPSDLALSPAESLRLYDTMASVSQGWPRAQELDPEMYKSFKNKIVIQKSDVREYEAELKKDLAGWVEAGRTNEVKEVLTILAPKVEGIFGRKHEDNFPLLVETLQKQNGLPAIFFIFSISLVEHFADNILRHLLRKAQSKRKPGHDKTKLQIESRIAKLSKYLEKEETLTRPSMKQAERLTQYRTEYELLIKKYQQLQELPPDCTFAQISAADQKFLDKVFFRIRWIHHSGYYRAMLRRGIGCHHGSLNKKFRQAVEMLFRRGFLKVVSATSTLALGINMPCKTVVFLEDSVHLDSLNYRQMSGRAGRRGLDNAGSVIFYKVPMSKVQRLLKANVPQLRGQFPLSITLVLRLMLLAAKADDQLDAKAKALSVLLHSLMTFNQPRKQNIVKYYFLYSLQFLLREGFLDREGHPQGFAGLVMHIHYHEPANFVLIRFLVQGLLHKICQPVNPSSNTFSEDVMETLVLILANLFGRRRLPSVLWEKRPTFLQSKVFLSDLPEDFAASVRKYNENAIHVFGNFLLSISQLADLEVESKLPLTNTTFLGPQEQEGTDFTAELSKCLNSPVTAVSPFACLSGHTDHNSINCYDIDPIIFRTLGIHMSNIPILPLKYYDSQGRRMPLNAYALDFYKHGSLTALTNDNGINRGEAYELIHDFSLVISAISTSVAELCDRDDDPVVLAFQQLQETYSAKLQKVAS